MTEGAADQKAFAAAIDRGRGIVTNKILKVKPDAGVNEVGGIFDAYGSSEWKPSRDPGADWSDWGPWEAWEHFKIEQCRLVASGSWIAWNAETKTIIGFGDKSMQTARQQAETMATLHNRGARTRVVGAIGVKASSMHYETVRAHVLARIQEDSRVQAEFDARLP